MAWSTTRVATPMDRPGSHRQHGHIRHFVEFSTRPSCNGNSTAHASQTSPKMMAGVAGMARGGDRKCWVESAGSDDVDEFLEGPISSMPCDDELIKPNYGTAYSEECFDSILIDYGTGTCPDIHRKVPTSRKSEFKMRGIFESTNHIA
ncbi:hypothetical protein H310_13365 [Aphanomyces invadans]|uniref:Uncharacterized protein n=1 Tax=Aphanomyces invadans TaxID=157072 RepID=A0A024TFE8_9STRA|nr:hypothetical protein H310_13365 [Aphanomyces invadans]ETV92311.1 hypothetical protein H310_13365 [Aphanomyces invadans]|eukprot:XP_008879062.1 hypothetical protein H310_13365 [Aphanomyces invadans]